MSERWLQVDWAMRGIMLAMHLCELAGLHDLAERLFDIHETAREHRDAA